MRRSERGNWRSIWMIRSNAALPSRRSTCARTRKRRVPFSEFRARRGIGAAYALAADALCGTAETSSSGSSIHNGSNPSRASVLMRRSRRPPTPMLPRSSVISPTARYVPMSNATRSPTQRRLRDSRRGRVVRFISEPYHQGLEPARVATWSRRTRSRHRASFAHRCRQPFTRANRRPSVPTFAGSKSWCAMALRQAFSSSSDARRSALRVSSTSSCAAHGAMRMGDLIELRGPDPQPVPKCKRTRHRRRVHHDRLPTLSKSACWPLARAA